MRAVLTETGPLVVVAGWLGAGLLVATAVPVARVFVLGPGSGRTAALAWPIVAYAPAVVGFTLLGLASRTLLARHAARAAGPDHRGRVGRGRGRRARPAARGAGRLAGARAGRRACRWAWSPVPSSAGGWSAGSTRASPPVGLAGPMWVGAAGAILAGGLGAAVSLLLAEARSSWPSLGAVGVSVLAVAIYAGVLRVAAPALFGRLWALRSRLAGTRRSPS